MEAPARPRENWADESYVAYGGFKGAVRIPQAD
jgi:hypothetical protein